MARALFGTDGIRAIAGEYPLDPPTVFALGAALGKLVLAGGHHRTVVIGMDTRESGPWMAATVAGGLATEGVAVQFAGVTTTPGVAFLARTGSFAAGVMISASHNPYHDNGIKIIDHSGYKLADAKEEQLESEMLRLLKEGPAVTPLELPVNPGLDQTYIDHLAASLPRGLAGMRIVLDCANGSASHLAPPLFRKLGAAVECPVGCEPNGRNINLDCGSLHMNSLREAVLARNADIGIAFDGDADRALFVSKAGRMVDGDAVLLLAARQLHAQGRLKGSDGNTSVIATVMSNLGLQLALATDGIGLVRTPVGDKYVLEEMLRSGSPLGGEQSGHVIFRQFATTGDGLLTALRVLDAMSATGRTLDELTEDLKIYPQKLVNVRVKNRRPLNELPGVNAEIQKVEEAFGDAGRVLVRFSGTEPLARVMVEGPDLPRVEAFAHRIASQIQTELES